LTLQRSGGPDLAFIEPTTGLQSNASIGYASIGNITFSGSDTSTNASGIYAGIESLVIDTNQDIQGSVNEGGSLWFNIWRHNVGATTRQRDKITALMIDNFARVGINTTTPTQALDVNGNLNMSATNTSIYFGGSYITKSGSAMIISD